MIHEVAFLNLPSTSSASGVEESPRRQATTPEEQASRNAVDELDSLIKERKLENKRKMGRDLTLDDFVSPNDPSLRLS